MRTKKQAPDGELPEISEIPEGALLVNAQQRVGERLLAKYHGSNDYFSIIGVSSGSVQNDMRMTLNREDLAAINKFVESIDRMLGASKSN